MTGTACDLSDCNEIEKTMNKSRVRLLFVISASTVFLMLNIVAVSSGSAGLFYEHIESSLDSDY